MGKRSGASGRLANPLVALSSAAVLTIYSAGYLRTRAAADRIQAADRSRVVLPAAPSAEPEHVAVRTAPETSPAATPVPRVNHALAHDRRKADPRHKVAMTAEHHAETSPAETPVAPSIATPVPVTPVAATPVAATPVATTAASAPTPVPEPTATPAPHYKDGTYSGWGTSRHGDIEATVVIAGGRITSAQITQCWTRYSCSLVAHLQGQVVTRQSPEVDYVSGATQSTNAFYYAVVQALSKAK